MVEDVIDDIIDDVPCRVYLALRITTFLKNAP